MKRVAKHEHPPVVTIPEVVGIAIVGVQPMIVTVAIDVEHVRVAMRIGNV